MALNNLDAVNDFSGPLLRGTLLWHAPLFRSAREYRGAAGRSSRQQCGSSTYSPAGPRCTCRASARLPKIVALEGARFPELH